MEPLGHNAMTGPVLSLRDFGVAFGERVVLSSVTLAVPDRGVLVLMGPSGTGKSTLVRTLAGFNAAHPSLRTWGEARYAGAPLGAGETPALVAQSARLMIASVLENVLNDLPERHGLTPTQRRDVAKHLLLRAGLGDLTHRLDESVVNLPLGVQRHLAILRLAVAGPRLLCIDEPTTGLDEEYSGILLDYIRAESARRAILVVLHNQVHARCLPGQTALLAGGCIQEWRPTAEFFGVPQSKAAKEFVRSGTCSLPSPNARPEELDSEVEPPPPLPEAARQYVSDAFGPRGFLWLEKGVLAGTPCPGVVVDIHYDLKALQRVGVTTLISLTEKPVDRVLLRQYGITTVWVPIKDMGAPDIAVAKDLCRHIQELAQAGEVIAVHCKAGLGRTGTVLAAYLIWKGHTALEALESVRRIEPRWVQSDEQVAFLEQFAAAVEGDRPARRRVAELSPGGDL